MADTSDLEAREAKHGQKMISVNVRFWTDELTEQGKILPKHAWVHGVVHLENESLSRNPAEQADSLQLVDGASLCH